MVGIETKVNKYSAPATSEVFRCELIGARAGDKLVRFVVFLFEFIFLFFKIYKRLLVW